MIASKSLILTLANYIYIKRKIVNTVNVGKTMLKMLDGLKGKISKFKKPDDSIVNKLDKIKKMEQQSASPVYSPDGSVKSLDPSLIAAQMGQIQEETIGKVEEDGRFQNRGLRQHF